MIHRAAPVVALLLALAAPAVAGGARVVETPYSEPRVVFDFFFDHPDKMGPALFWIRSLINPLSEAPYNMAPELMQVVVIVHGTEIVTLAKKNYEKYAESVERMRYYAQLGVKFRVCGLAAHDYSYTPDDLQDFVEIAPSALTELVHWQQQGYALITPLITDKRLPIEQIR